MAGMAWEQDLSTFLIASGAIAIATELQTSLHEVWLLLCCLENNHFILIVYGFI